jgi:predicted ATP-dependent endonuclease of OLD family
MFSKEETSDNLIETINTAKKTISNQIKKVKDTKNKRPISVLKDTLYLNYLDSSIPQSFDIDEYSVSLIDETQKSLNTLISVQRVVYIDTPMSLGQIGSKEKQYWTDLNKILNNRGLGSRIKSIDQIFTENVFKGEIIQNENNLIKNPFLYKRSDGSEFDLMECATGLKSFAILQILYKNGFLGKDTLLIIDEPEAHLHPQWVVEYARLVVMLNKNLGVNFLIASHHPEMISAIRYISEKEGNQNVVNFYLAEKKKNIYKYDYLDLGLDIEPIFKSFNLAYERLDRYGKTD